MIIRFFIILSLFIMGCASTQISPVEEVVDTKKVLREHFDSLDYVKEKSELNLAAEDLKSSNFALAASRYGEFLNKYPQSLHFTEAVYGLGFALEGLSQYSDAINQYLKITQTKVEGSQDYPSRAFYRLSFCYEAIGDIEKAIISLKDAERMQVYLPLEIASAELPGRFAALYARIGEMEISSLYVQRTEIGIENVKKYKDKTDVDWLGSSLTQIGHLNLNHLDKENFHQSIRSLIKTQKYLVRAMSLKSSIYNQKAQSDLVFNYSKLLGFIKAQKISYSDFQLGQVETARFQASLAGDLLEALELLKFDNPAIKTDNDLFGNLNTLLSKIEDELKEILVYNLNISPLTPEAEQFVRLKREFKFQNVDLLTPPLELVRVPDGVPTKLPSKKKKEDPNL